MIFLSGGTAPRTNRTVTPLTAIRVPRAAMRRAMAEITEMGDIVIPVFAGRRRQRIESGQNGLTLIGAEADRAVRQIEALSAQNRIPFRADAKGFVLTDSSHATSHPGIFAVVDLCNGSVKRMASAVGYPHPCQQAILADEPVVRRGNHMQDKQSFRHQRHQTCGTGTKDSDVQGRRKGLAVGIWFRLFHLPRQDAGRGFSEANNTAS